MSDVLLLAAAVAILATVVGKVALCWRRIWGQVIAKPAAGGASFIIAAANPAAALAATGRRK